MQFLADESCDFAVVTALRAPGHDVTAVAETSVGAEDDVVLAAARAEARTLITEDKDFGLLAFATVRETAGVVLIRSPASARRGLGRDVVDFVAGVGARIIGAFVVLEPGRARLSGPTANMQ
jgi:predicted nuclease of predicted toxin-antitoxin system